jgi:hypothetical protein
MKNMKNSFDFSMALLAVLSFFFPLILSLGSQEYSFCNYMEGYKEFTFPFLILLFSSYWLYYKYKSKGLEYDEYRLSEANKKTNGTIEESRNKSNLEKDINIKRIHLRSIINLEHIIAAIGILHGLLSIISFLICKNN